jgi:ribose 5-phosphate isomerase A
LSWREEAKKIVAVKAVSHLKDEQIIGLGSGTTVAYALEETARRIKEEKLRILGVPTSYHTYYLAIKHGIPLTTLDANPKLDITIDGADQVDKNLTMIKGVGGALTREKIVAHATKQYIIIIDETKMTTHLGENQPIPIEVLPFALATVNVKLQKLNGKPKLRESDRKLSPITTDNGNFILDTYFGSIDNPKRLDRAIKEIPGVIETGLFIDLADIVYIGKRTAIQKLERQNR